MYTYFFAFSDTIICYVANCIPLLVQQNVDGSDFFNRSWEEFKVGFNDTTGNYWLGNELLHQLTSKGGRYKLRFDLQERYNYSWYYAEYSFFTVFSEADNYKMRVSGYTGNAGDRLGFLYHDGMMFTTYDRDNDPYINAVHNDNCAVASGGGFWYRRCSHAGVNTVRGSGNNFRWYDAGRSLVLQSSRMWLTC